MLNSHIMIIFENDENDDWNDVISLSHKNYLIAFEMTKAMR